MVSRNNQSRKHLALKLSVFSTGLAGTVAEYIMATIATYLLGNAVIQWALIISVMLFAMGLGSRLSKIIKLNVLDAYIFTELILSVCIAVSAILAYFLTAYVQQVSLVIYPVAILIGGLIGLEIPLATRINEEFEELRFNISSIMEKDYFGALLGGLLFSFFALPSLGLTYTPIALGTLNFLIAGLLFWSFRQEISHKPQIIIGFVISMAFLIGVFFLARPIVLFGEQERYQDRIIYEEQTPYQKIVVTEWKGHHWLYLNNNEQFSSYDEYRYHEPLVHPAMQASVARKNVLILGGGDGLAAREVLKYPEVERITIVDIDERVVELCKTHPVFSRLNQGSLSHEKVQSVFQDAYIFLEQSQEFYDVIIIDLPDPKTIDLARLYSKEFYLLCKSHVSKGGVVVTQATSPHFAKNAFLSIYKTIEESGFSAVAFHNHVPTMGEWGWVLGINQKGITREKIRYELSKLEFDSLPTKFLNHEAMKGMLYFGKDIFGDYSEIIPTTQSDPAVFNYYRNKGWEIY